MRPFRLSLWCSVLMLAGASQAQAAWDNVFQVTCFGCKKPPVTAQYYAPPAPVAAPCQQPACQQPACQTRYYLRTYYQPVTTYRTSCYYEPVTTYRTSYYYEPVTSYRYSCYVDPCTGCTSQRAVPTTSYQILRQSCPVTSYLQRTQLVPETCYKQAYYYEPVTQCCQTTVGAPIYPNSPGGVTESPPAQPQPSGGVGETRDRLPNTPSSFKPVVPDTQIRYAPPSVNNPSYRQPMLQPPVPVQQPQAQKETQPPPTVRIDRIVKIETTTNVEGQVVLLNQNPQPGTESTLSVRINSAPNRRLPPTRKANSKSTSRQAAGWSMFTTRRVLQSTRKRSR